MSITLQLQHNIQTDAPPTQRTMDIAAMFGLSLDRTHNHTIIPPIKLNLAPGQIVFVTGTSGGGKSTLLRLIAQSIQSQQCPGLLPIEQLPDLPNTALVDALARPEGDASPHPAPATLDRVCHWLSQAGLNDAAVMLRRPTELSVGQRHRLKLAQAMAAAQRRSEAWSVLLADEFCSSLDRTTAIALALSVRRWVSRSQTCLVAATAHDDLLEPLDPDVLIEVGPGGHCEVLRRDD